MRIISIIKKNVKILLRSRASALIVLLGPLLIIFLVGLAFDNANMFKVNIGVYSEQYNDLTESFIDKLGERQFSITKVRSEEGCVRDIQAGRQHICIVFPKNMTVQANLTNEIIFYVDSSRINLVWAVRDIITEKLETRSKEISVDLTDAILAKLEGAQQEIRNQKPVVVSFTNDYTSITKEVESIENNLEALQLDFNVEDLKLNELKNSSDEMVYMVSLIVDKANSALGSVSSDIKDMGNVTGGDSTQRKISETRNWLVKAEKIVNENKDDLAGLLDELEATAGSTESKFSKADSTRDDSLKRIEEINSRAASSLKNIVSIQESLNKIDTSVEAINVRDSETIVNPIETTMKPVITEDSHLDYIFPGLLILVVMFLSILLASTLVIMEKESEAYFRNFITPTHDIIFYLATYLSALLVMLVMILLMVFIAMAFFTTAVLSTLATTLIVLLIITSMFIFLGMAIGYFFNSETTSTLASVSFASVFLLLSGIIFPIESMPSYMIRVAQLNPFVIGEMLLKRSILFRTSLFELGSNLWIVIGYLVGLMLLGIIIQQLNKKNYFSKYLKRFVPKKQKKKA